MFTNYTEVIKVPDNWTDFDNERDELREEIAEKLDNNEKADKIINIIIIIAIFSKQENKSLFIKKKIKF